MRVNAAANRPVWLPNTTPPKWLDGTLAGDNGFDPLGLGSDPQRLKWCVRVRRGWSFRSARCVWPVDRTHAPPAAGHILRGQTRRPCDRQAALA